MGKIAIAVVGDAAGELHGVTFSFDPEYGGKLSTSGGSPRQFVDLDDDFLHSLLWDALVNLATVRREAVALHKLRRPRHPFRPATKLDAAPLELADQPGDLPGCDGKSETPDPSAAGQTPGDTSSPPASAPPGDAPDSGR